MESKASKLFIILGAFFITNAVLAEFIGVKIFSLESTFGLQPVDWTILGFHLSFSLTCGVVVWPVVFIMTDIINEYYGQRGVRFLSYLAVGMIVYAFLMVYIAIHLAPASWWTGNYTSQGIPDMQKAFGGIFGQGLSIIFASVLAFFIGQVVDVLVFHRIKKATGDKHLWLRSTGSTVISQLIDSFVVLFVAFYLLGNFTFDQVIAICIMNYIYKFSIAVILTPLLYVVHGIIDRYLGKDLAKEMVHKAANK